MEAVMKNFTGTLPRIEKFVGNCPRRNETKLSNAQKIRDFVFSPELHLFCEKNRLQEAFMMQVTVGRKIKAYALTEEKTLCDFVINILPEEGIRDYKADKVIATPSFKENKIFCSATYWVSQDEAGYWQAREILADDAYLDNQKTDKAFALLADFKGYISFESFDADVCLKVNGVSHQTKARVALALKSGCSRYLLCLYDNGKILDVPFEDIEVKKLNVPEMGLLKTKFNWLKNTGSGYSRIK